MSPSAQTLAQVTSTTASIMSQTTPSSASWTIAGERPIQPVEINLDEDSDLETVNYEEHDQAQVLLDTGASQHVIGEAHLQRLQQDMQQQMGMLAQGMQTMHQQMQQAATPPSVKLKAAPTGPPPMLGPSGWAIPQEKAPPARAWPVSPPPSVPQPAARATPAPKRAPPKNTDHMECDEGEIPSPTTPEWCFQRLSVGHRQGDQQPLRAPRRRRLRARALRAHTLRVSRCWPRALPMRRRSYAACGVFVSRRARCETRSAKLAQST